MTRTLINAALIAALFAGIYALATAPAMWWLSDAEKAELIDQAQKTHGTEAAQYLRAITR